MFENLEVFRTAHAMARHAGARQAVIARNMANADTPGYAAQDIAGFKETFDAAQRSFQARATRPSHLNAAAQGPAYIVEDRAGALPDPNGNSVTVESEMMHAVNTKRQHDRALTIYRTSLGILRTAIGRR
jgi:flagellar basal-body rod protein FlgB